MEDTGIDSKLQSELSEIFNSDNHHYLLYYRQRQRGDNNNDNNNDDGDGQANSKE